MKETKRIIQFSSFAQLCPTLCDPMNCSTPGLPVSLKEENHGSPISCKQHPSHCQSLMTKYLNISAQGMENGTAFFKTAWWFLTKLNILLPHNAAITLLGIHPKELKT